MTSFLMFLAIVSVEEGSFDKVIRPFLQQHCFQCHVGEAADGALQLDTLSGDFVEGSSIPRWLEVIERLGSGDMPPSEVEVRPSAEETSEVIQWLSSQIEEGKASRLAQRGQGRFSRLTREEYGNTIRDLLGVHFDVRDVEGLNEDEVWRGFRRIGSVLSISAPHVMKYLAAAEAIVDEAFPAIPPQFMSGRLDAFALMGGEALFGKKKVRDLHESGKIDDLRVDLWPGQYLRPLVGEGLFSHSGVYRFRIQLSGLRAVEGRAPHLTFSVSTLDRLLFEKDVVSSERDPVTLEFSAHLPAGRHRFVLENAVEGPLILSRIGRSPHRPFFGLEEGRIPWQIELKTEDHEPLHPLLIVDHIEWEGPIVGEERLLRDRFLRVEGMNEEKVRDGLTSFAQAAFRRPLEPGEIEPYLHLALGGEERGQDLLGGFKAAMAAILCSPHFLFLHDGVADSGPLDEWRLAARLSYFLRSSLPDQELLDAAVEGTLSQPDGLKAQAMRLMSTSGIDRFVETFCREWLQLDRVGMFPPDRELYPDYDAYLERSMVRETTAFFGRMLTENRPLEEFLDSEWTMLNERLSRHYGIDGIEGDQFRPVPLAPYQQRGGVLTHASTLSLTSDGTRHRPVHRGVWLSESIFDDVPPPPPANVEPLESVAPSAKKKTIREKLEDHRRRESCASCHRRLDPLGLAFENYDAIGRWRTAEAHGRGTGEDPTVDASGVLADGRPFADAREFKRLLIEDIDTFAEAFVRKLATYALRRVMTVDDREAIQGIVGETRESGYRLRDIIEALVASDLFRQ